MMQTVLEADNGLLTVPNARKKTPTDLAVQCEGKHTIERLYSVVVFDHFQLLSLGSPLYKSPTAEVHECWDLRHERTGAQAGQRFVIKLISDPDLWLRELATRDAVGTVTSAARACVGAVSARSSTRWAPRTGAGRRAEAALQYGRSADTEHRPVTVARATSAETAAIRREALAMMAEYPYAIVMPLADRNLAEIIASERLATEPLDVIRSSGEQLLRLLDDMHEAGVVHGDVKPKNVVRVDRELRLIDLDWRHRGERQAARPRPSWRGAARTPRPSCCSGWKHTAARRRGRRAVGAARSTRSNRRCRWTCGALR